MTARAACRRQTAWVSPVPQVRPDEEGVVFRIIGLDGWDLSVEATGRVVHVADTSVNGSRGDYVTWTATPARR